MYIDNSYVTVDLDRIAANFRAIREKAGVPVMAVIKADGYGHGAVPIAKKLAEDCGFFGVATLSEALELRNAGITAPILVLSPIHPEAYEIAVREEIRPAIFHYEDALSLSQAAQKLKKTAYFHVAVDTGMSRIGFQVTEEAADICKKICQLPGLQAEGLFSHFATADSADLTKAKAQAERFRIFDEMLKARGVEIPLRHLDNSAGIMNFDSHYQMVRAGIILYGLEPSREVDITGLQPALSWYSRVTHLKTLEPGREIGYGGTFTTVKPTAVATISVGYADGYRRSLSNKFYVLIRGRKAPILGRVCMDQMMVDVTDIPDAAVGDRVTLLGEGLTAEEMAAAIGTINYEVVCAIGKRVPRYYL
ncbi:MAG: alanine racemase [Oscillospiraceae bacterium]|nr:alanine racemase [Oscillospiraceae bacterium]